MERLKNISLAGVSLALYLMDALTTSLANLVELAKPFLA